MVERGDRQLVSVKSTIYGENNTFITLQRPMKSLLTFDFYLQGVRLFLKFGGCQPTILQ